MNCLCKYERVSGGGGEVFCRGILVQCLTRSLYVFVVVSI
jgi:hypothetical protein